MTRKKVAGMNDDKLERVLEMVFEVEDLDDGESCERNRECLSMARLEAIGALDMKATVPEKEHLLRCSRCRHRRAAFREPATPPSPQAMRRPAEPRGVMIALSLLGLGAAAAVTLALWLRTMDVTPPSTVPLTPTMAHYVEGAGGEPADRFQLIAEEGCAVVALLRTWSSDCECLSWKIHEWKGEQGERIQRSTLGAGELLSIDVNTGEEPPVPQYLVVVLARRAEDLPAGPDAAQELLSCLEGVVPEKANGDFLVELPACLPNSGIELLAKTF